MPAALTDRHQDPETSEDEARTRRAAMRRNAHRNGIVLENTVVWGSYILALDVSGNLYRWLGKRWVRLEPVTTGARRASRAAAGTVPSLLGQAGGG